MIRDGRTSVSIAEPSGLVSGRWRKAIETDDSDVVWEEMEFTILRESNMGVNGLLVMFVSGALAAVGIATGAIHLVIGAMVIAPGFEPINRIGLGFVSGGSLGWRRGLLDTARGYAALVTGALVAGLLLRMGGRDLLRSEAGYVATTDMIELWLALSLPNLLVAVIAGTAGAVLIAVNRSVLTAGVMIALALVPPPAIAALALIEGTPNLIGSATVRWVVEAGIVAGTAIAVFGWKRMAIQKRSAVG